jgi:uncharacterized protein YecE (DUF72 family)
MNLCVGTSGYSYKEWKGSFYPDDIAAGDMLQHYATKLPAVEINNTFYRLPRANVLENWAEAVPDGFRFAIKASRRITHLKRLKEPVEEMNYLLDAVQTLGPKLGLVLYQLPPNFKKDLDRFEAFLDLLRPDCRSVFEFRHETWYEDDVFALLRDKGCALCIADVDDEPEPEIVSTAPFGYLRLRRTQYGADDLARWAERVQAQDWDDAYVFFKHEDEASGPEAAAGFLKAAGV